jgi:hypothetical protein
MTTKTNVETSTNMETFKSSPLQEAHATRLQWAIELKKTLDWKELTPENAPTLSDEERKLVNEQRLKERNTKYAQKKAEIEADPSYTSVVAVMGKAKKVRDDMAELKGITKADAEAELYNKLPKTSRETEKNLFETEEISQLEDKLINLVDSKRKERVEGWMNIKKKNVNQTEYLEALQRRTTEHENQEQWRKKLGKPLTLSQSKLNKNADGIHTEGDALAMKREVKNSVNLPKGLKFTPGEDILDLLNKLAGTHFATVEEASKGGNPIDWALAASILDLTQFEQRDGNSYP